MGAEDALENVNGFYLYDARNLQPRVSLAIEIETDSLSLESLMKESVHAGVSAAHGSLSLSGSEFLAVVEEQ